MTPRPLDAASAPPTDRYCDLVLTGGVTDGVVYPWAVIELAHHYHFKNIGGTSVGAMAAALTAAAEYSRRRGILAGFNEVMFKIPERLAETVEGIGTRIYSLFQPAKSTERLFELFVRFFSSGAISLQEAATAHIGVAAPADDAPAAATLLDRALARLPAWLKALLILVSVYRGAACAGAAIALVIFLFPLGAGLDSVMAHPPCYAVLVAAAMALFVAIPLIAFFSLVFVAFAIGRDLLRALVPNGFGMCTGMRPDHVPADRPSLIEWLHEGIQLAAAKPLDAPLTFSDLWNAPGGPASAPLPPGRRRKARSIDLRMISTNVTHGRPYEFPPDPDTRLFFDPDELRQYFPEAVVRHLESHSLCYAAARRPDDPAPTPDTARLRQLPVGELPVVVAARLSLSFPFLFSAVPLWEIDCEPRQAHLRRLRRCRFSDGGICSNFPIHMFDAAVPEWPTFGIALEARSVFRPGERLWLTTLHHEGREDPWFRFDELENPVTHEPASPAGRLLGFVGSIFYSAKDWNDKSLTRLPGVRDRIVHLTLERTGGLNLRLSGDEIIKLAEQYGAPAGRALVEKFIDRQENRPARAWEEHRWVRFNTFLVALRERIEMLQDAVRNYRYGTPLPAQIASAVTQRPLAGNDPAGEVLTAAQARNLESLLAALEQLEREFAQASLAQHYKPVPAPGLRIRPPL